MLTRIVRSPPPLSIIYITHSLLLPVQPTADISNDLNSYLSIMHDQITIANSSPHRPRTLWEASLLRGSYTCRIILSAFRGRWK
jgi:hypothetical protein